MTLPKPVSSDLPITASAQTLSNRLDGLLVLRGLACLMVVIIHSGPPAKSIFYRGIDLSWLTFSHGFAAVWIFFCLSGYLMGKAFFTGRYGLNRQGVFNFWRNRAVRILPLYYFSVFILTIFVYPEMLKLENWGHLVRVCTFTYAGWLVPSPPAFNLSMWSLSTEVQFYFLVPFVYAMSQGLCRNSRRALLAMGMGVVLVFCLKLGVWVAFRKEITDSIYFAFKYWYMPLAMNFDVFLIGFLMNPLLQAQQERGQEKVSERNGSRPIAQMAKSSWFWFLSRLSSAFRVLTHKWVAIALLIGFYLFTAHHLYHQELFSIGPRPVGGFRTTTTIFILQPLTALVVAIFIGAFERTPSGGQHPQSQPLSFQAILDNPIRALEILGILSYGIYIWHWPILGKISPIITSTFPVEAFYLRLTTTLLLSAAMATLTYYLVEIPAARWKLYRPPSSSR
jgi:peptidoglycan/LPS O-acetylase OafA/YrhL